MDDSSTTAATMMLLQLCTGVCIWVTFKSSIVRQYHMQKKNLPGVPCHEVILSIASKPCGVSVPHQRIARFIAPRNHCTSDTFPLLTTTPTLARAVRK